MKIKVLSSDAQWEELTGLNSSVEWERAITGNEVIEADETFAFFNLNEDAHSTDFSHFSIPVFIHAVNDTLTGSQLPAQVIRINAWPGFLQRPVWEYAGNLSDDHRRVFEILDKKPAKADDEPGLISARVIAMIVNEAYFALQDGISTKEEIDTAMKLGTNYPYGPFEWSSAIGLNKILNLLETLYSTDSRYKPADLMRKEWEA